MDTESVLQFPSELTAPPHRRTKQWLRRFVDSDKMLPACLALAAVLRISCIWIFDVRPMSDFAWYYDVAASIADGRGAVAHGHPTAYWPIGYPALLASLFALVGPSALAAQLLNVALAIGTLLLVHRLVLLFGGTPRTARVAVLLLALWPNQIAYTSLLASETFASFLLLLGVTLLLGRRWWRDVLAGVVFGLACLVKPQTVLLAMTVVIVAQLATWRESKRPLRRMLLRTGVLYLALTVVLVPWSVRNWRVFGGFVFIANSGGVNLLIGNRSEANGTYPKPDGEARLLASLQPFSIETSEYQADKKGRTLAVDYLKHHPGRTLLRLPRKLWYLYEKDADGFSWMQEGAPSTQGRYRLLPVLKLVAQTYYTLVLLVLIPILYLALRRRRARALYIPVGVVAYLTCVHLPYFGISRFHFSMVPWLSACVALGAQALARSKGTEDSSTPSPSMANAPEAVA